MVRLLGMIFGLLMAASLASGAIAHAVEGPIGVERSNAACTNDTGDEGDSPSADDGKDVVHLDDCHSHHVGVPIRTSIEVALPEAVNLVPLAGNQALPQAPPGVMHRPPIA